MKVRKYPHTNKKKHESKNFIKTQSKCANNKGQKDMESTNKL